MSKNKIKNWAIDDEKIELFMEEVLRKHLLPNARKKSAGAIGPYEAKKFNYANIHLADSFSIYKDSRYYYDGEYKFTHFTSLPNAINIIRDKKIRMYDLNGMDDKNEFYYGGEIFKNNNREYLTEEIKSNIFILSICKYNSEKSETLTQWREFGHDGNGIAIVFRFNKNFRNHWVHFVLSEIYYQPKEIKNLEAAWKAYLNFKTKYNFTVNTCNEIFYKILGFHKLPIYKNENEVRLIYNEGFSLHDVPNKKIKDIKGGKLTPYIELDIEWDKNGSNYKLPLELKKHEPLMKMIYPHIEIEKVILGYRLSNKSKRDIGEVISFHSTNYKN